MGKFLNQKEIAIAKHEQEVFNSKVKRGEINPTTYVRTHYVVCGCGAEGCGFITRWMKNQSNVIDLKEQETQYQLWLSNRT
jgi:hypothetical protein